MNQIQSKSVLCFVFIFLFFSGCKKDNNVEVTTSVSSVLLPLTKGNSWTFLRTQYDTSGTVISTDTITHTISKDSSLYGFSWGYDSTDQVLYRNDEQGLWRYINEPRLYYRYPSSPNIEFLQDFWSTSIISIDTLIATPAGTFHCYHYRVNFNDYPIDQFISPNLGFVKMEYAWYYPTQPSGRLVSYLSSRIELLSINIKQ